MTSPTSSHEQDSAASHLKALQDAIVKEDRIGAVKVVQSMIGTISDRDRARLVLLATIATSVGGSLHDFGVFVSAVIGGHDPVVVMQLITAILKNAGPRGEAIDVAIVAYADTVRSNTKPSRQRPRKATPPAKRAPQARRKRPVTN